MSDRFYGYSRGQPCILIKLNRVGNLWDQVQLVLEALEVCRETPPLQVISVRFVSAGDRDVTWEGWGVSLCHLRSQGLPVSR